MSKGKKGFVLYFDNYPMLNVLPPAERGWLLSALMVYADRVWRDSTVTMEEILDQFPQLSNEARMAGAFIGASICRDTGAWLARARYRDQKRQERAACEHDERASQDMEQIRQLMERFHTQKA